MILKEKPNIFPNEFDFSLSKFLKFKWSNLFPYEFFKI